MRRYYHLRDLERACISFTWLFPKLLVNGLLLWAVASTLFDICPQMSPVLAILVGTCSLALYTMSVLCYFATIRYSGKSPMDVNGYAVRPPSLFPVDEESAGLSPPQVPDDGAFLTAKYDGQLRFCNKCGCWKPDRTHHCSTCNRCILKMDHHCPWFACCLGFSNYKFFVQFLFYTVLFCIVTCIVSGYSVVHFFMEQEYLDAYLSINVLVLAVISFAASLALSGFLAYTLYLVLHNRTTIESMEPLRYKSLSTKILNRFREAPSSDALGNIFDVGYKENWRQVMGQTWLQWLLPTPSYFGDGTTFPIDQAIMAKISQRVEQDRLLLDRLRRETQAHDIGPRPVPVDSEQ